MVLKPEGTVFFVKPEGTVFFIKPEGTVFFIKTSVTVFLAKYGATVFLANYELISLKGTVARYLLLPNFFPQRAKVRRFCGNRFF